MRVNTRHLLVDSAIALVLGWICFWAAQVSWDPGRGRGEHPVGPPRFGPPDFGPPRIELPGVADWVAAPLLLLVVGLAVRRIWPRSGFVAVVLGVGGYLAAWVIAYGVVQSLPAEKMASAGADYRTNYRTQINWGLQYIQDRYGSPCGALNFHYANNWY